MTCVPTGFVWKKIAPGGRNGSWHDGRTFTLRPGMPWIRGGEARALPMSCPICAGAPAPTAPAKAGARSPAPESGSGIGAPMRNDEAVAELRELELRRAALKSLELRLEAAENALDALPQEEKLILTLCYVRPKRGNLERLMEALGVEKTRIYEKRNAALRKFALAWAGDAGAEK